MTALLTDKADGSVVLVELSDGYFRECNNQRLSSSGMLYAVLKNNLGDEAISLQSVYDDNH